MKHGKTGRFKLFPTILFSDKIFCFTELPRDGIHKLDRIIPLKIYSFMIRGEIDRKSGGQVSRALPPRMYGRNCDAVQVVDGESDECEGDEIVFQARWTDEALEWIGVLNLVLLQM
jgi:hypothetical protein